MVSMFRVLCLLDQVIQLCREDRIAADIKSSHSSVLHGSELISNRGCVLKVGIPEEAGFSRCEGDVQPD